MTLEELKQEWLRTSGEISRGGGEETKARAQEAKQLYFEALEKETKKFGNKK